MVVNKTKNELRCFCSRGPLLAIYGIGTDGLLYVHVKIFKQRRVFGEVLVTEGRVRLHCRECLRWHTVVIHSTNEAALREDKSPPSLAIEAS